METISDDREAIVENVGRAMAELRARRGVSMRELSRRTHINAWQLAALERGERDVVVSTLVRIVGALGYELEYREVRS